MLLLDASTRATSSCPFHSGSGSLYESFAPSSTSKILTTNSNVSLLRAGYGVTENTFTKFNHPNQRSCTRLSLTSVISNSLPSVSAMYSSQLSPSSLWQDVFSSFVVEVSNAERLPLNVDLLAPFTIASTRLKTVQNVIIRIELADGSVGWGEAPTLPPVTAETQPIALEKALHACSYLRSIPPTTCSKVLQEINDLLPGENSASVRAGVEMALVDAVSRSVGLPLWQLFGGCNNSVTTDITIPISTLEEAVRLAAEYADRGFKTLKLKVGGKKISADLEVIMAIQKQHPQNQLILDANEGYRPDEALELLKVLHEVGITPVLLEQPVPKDDWRDLGYVSKMANELFGVPVAADESCRSLHDAERIASDNLADVINIKLAKMGLIGALEIIQFARAAGLQLMIGGMVETRFAMGFAAHLAAGQGCFKFIDLDTPLLLAEDPVHGGYIVEGPVYKLNAALGHGAYMHWHTT